MSEARKVLSNTASQVMARILVGLLGIVSIKLITNYFSGNIGLYGEYTIIYDFTAIFTIIADFGLFTIAVREMAQDGKKEATVLGNILSMRMTLALLAFGLAIAAAYLNPKFQGSFIPFGVMVVAVANMLTLLAGTISSILQVHLKMQWASLAQVLGKIITVIYIAYAILFLFPNNPEKGFHHLLYAWIFGALLTVLLTFLPAKKMVLIRFRFDWVYWKGIIIKALPYGIALLLAQLYFRTGTVIMSFFDLKEDVGMYGVAIRGIEIGVLIPAYFMNSLLPTITRSFKESIEKTKQIIQHGFDAMAILVFPMLLGGVVLAKPLIAFLASDAFLSKGGLNGLGGIPGSDTALTIVLFGMTFTFLHYVFGFSLVAIGKQYALLKINLVAAIVNISLNFILIPRFSFVGVSFSAVIAEFIIFLLGWFALRKHISFSPKIWLSIKALFSALIMGIAVYFLDIPMREIMGLKSLLIIIPLGGLVYAGMLILTKTLTPEMLAVFKKRGDKASPQEIL